MADFVSFASAVFNTVVQLWSLMTGNFIFLSVLALWLLKKVSKLFDIVKG